MNLKPLPKLLSVFLLMTLIILPGMRSLGQVITNWEEIGISGNGLGQFNQPLQVQVAKNGDLYVVDHGNHRIQVKRNTGEWQSFGSHGTDPGHLNYPWGLVVDESGFLWVSEIYADRIQRLNLSTNEWNVVTGLSQPKQMSISKSGSVYVANSWGNNILVVDSTLTWTTFGMSDLKLGTLDTPTHCLEDRRGNKWIPDRMGRILQQDKQGKWQSFGEFGWQYAHLWRPECIAIDSKGNLYVADSVNSRIARMDTYGRWSEVLEGGAGVGYVNNPNSITIDDFDKIYVSDTTNNRVVSFNYAISDLTPPTSSIISGLLDTWTKNSVKVSLACPDNINGAGTKQFHYQVDLGYETVIDDFYDYTSSGPAVSIDLVDSGVHIVKFYGIDNNGNTETTQYATVKIDKIAPVTTLSRNAGLITLSATDAHSGVAKIKYQINGGAVADYSVPFADTVHKVTYWAEDAAGNIEAAKTDVINAGVQSISVTQPRLNGGTGVVGTVTLDKAAGIGGTVINLASSLPGVAFVDPTVTVPEGAITATFDIDAYPVAIDTSVSITASIYETSQSALLTVQAPMPSSISWSVTPVIGGTSTTGTLTLTSPAPAGGTTVSLASSSLSALVGSSVTIPAGSMTTTFTVSTNAVSNDSSAVISATVYGVKLKSTLSILGPKVTSVTLAASSVVSLGTTTGTVTLSTNAPVGGKVVTLSSSNVAVASVPISVTVAAGTKTATFTVTAGSVNASTTATITAATNGSNGTASITVTPPPAAISGITTNVAAVTGGLAVTGTVTLTSPAPTGGAVIALASTPTTAGTVPASVTVAAGATTATFTITTKTVTAATTLTVNGTYLGVAKAVSITVNPARVVSTLTLNPTTVKGGTNSTGTITLTGIATENVVVSLTSGTTTVATVPTSVTVLAGSSTATFTITTLTQTATRTSIITARTGTTSKTATLSVTR